MVEGASTVSHSEWRTIPQRAPSGTAGAARVIHNPPADHPLTREAGGFWSPARAPG